MKKVQFLALLILPLFCFSQLESNSFGGEYKFNPDNIPCISKEAKAQIKIEIQESIKNLITKGKISPHKSALAPPSFAWPIKAKDNSEFTDVWAISNYVDHNNNFPDKLEDYNCGTRTYDTTSGYNHQGTDMFTWPFTWYQFQNNTAEVIAAAPGIITLKHDGEFDMSCSFNNNQWNAIYIKHSDGSIAWYGHLKKGSLTTKNVGDNVAEGEYLGVVGSSGNSSGPHLHFEVYDSNNNLVDPFQGNCSSGASLWQNQPAYSDPHINAIFTHNAPPDFKFSDCPDVETTNFADQFLPNTDVLTATYYKDQLSGTTASYKLYKPNGSVHTTWTFDFVDTFGSSYWYWTWNDLSDLGVWKFESSYQGQTLTKTFEIVTALGIENHELNKISIAPNPFENTLKLIGFDLDKDNYKMTVFNNLGQKVFSTTTFSDELDLHFLSKGMYFLKITDKTDSSYKTFTILKK